MSRSTFERFTELASASQVKPSAAAAGDGTRIVPVWRDCVFDADTPVSAFAKLRREPFGFLLESAPAGGETWARYTYLGTQPRAAWRYKDGVVEDWSSTGGWHNSRTPDDPLADLDAIVSTPQPVDVPELGAFWTGAVGYFGYDIVRLIERLPHGKPRDQTFPTHFSFSREPWWSWTTFARRRESSSASSSLATSLPTCFAKSTTKRFVRSTRSSRDSTSLRGSRRWHSIATRRRQAGARALTAKHSCAASSGSANTFAPVIASRRFSPGASTFALTSSQGLCIVRCAHSIRRRTCITSCSTAWSSSAARPSCSCACSMSG